MVRPDGQSMNRCGIVYEPPSMVMLLLNANLPVMMIYGVRVLPALDPSLMMTLSDFAHPAVDDGSCIAKVPSNDSPVTSNTAPSGPALESISETIRVVPETAIESPPVLTVEPDEMNEGRAAASPLSTTTNVQTARSSGRNSTDVCSGRRGVSIVDYDAPL